MDKEVSEGQEPAQSEVAEVDAVEVKPDPAVEAMRAELDARTKAYDALEEKLKDAKSAEEYERVVADYSTQVDELNRQLAHQTVMNKHGLGEDFAEFVYGDTEDEMTERATRLVALLKAGVAAPTNRPGGGVSGASVGSPKELPDDPAELAKMVPRGGLTSL